MISSRFYSPGKVGPDDLTWSLPTCLVLWFCEPSLVWLKLSCFPLNTAGVARGSCVPRLHQPRLWKLVGRRVQTVPRCCAVRWDLDCKLFKLCFVPYKTSPGQMWVKLSLHWIWKGCLLSCWNQHRRCVLTRVNNVPSLVLFFLSTWAPCQRYFVERYMGMAICRDNVYLSTSCNCFPWRDEM